ncbi:hypothetical protein [Pseudoruegeria sp. SK021]|uniref:hypothetical protein n=1 Tax=Pseudoruegeria sp. SK021 TaxID=1933035 RepID=UPI000A2556C0|nr:hypothetical protein [Pseudoruegeria sp. SK021]OSP54099.1 hypothetical protein BV911_14530 [Pseudoruegeria sp. SK021]
MRGGNAIHRVFIWRVYDGHISRNEDGMIAGDPDRMGVRISATAGRDALCYGIALLACLAIVLLNGTPLFYFDTGSYLAVGQKMIDSLLRLLPGEAAIPASGTGAGGGETLPVESSRSPVFSLMSGLFASVHQLGAMTVFNAALVLAAVWLMVRVAARQITPSLAVAPAVCLSLLVACLGSLPFYVAFLMPDIYAPLLILTIASLTGFGRQMTRWEILAWLALGVLSVSTHTSHLLIAILLLPLSAGLSLLVSRKRWWLAPLLVACIVVAGIGLKSVFNVAVKQMSGRETLAMPFLTARLFQDGVTYTFLETHCETAAFATCALYQVLAQPGDPMRRTATHILFERTPELGSYRLLTQPEQVAIAQEQYRLFAAVLRAMPVQTSLAFLKNTLRQVRMNRVDMTLPTAALVERFADEDGLAKGAFRLGGVSRNTAWLDPVTVAQNLLYGTSLLVLLALLVWPGKMTGPLRALVLMGLLGVLTNAFVCGGVSQPATRYGARVIWLLPLLATFCALYGRPRADMGAAASPEP